MSRSQQAAGAKKSEPITDVPASPLRRWFRFLLRLITMVIVVLGIGIWMVYYSAQKEPEFYQAALLVDEQEEAEQGDVFEKNVLDLQNDARLNREWRAVFTEAQINGWLASDFPAKFPNTLPRQVSDPRVGIDEDVLRIAFRFNSRRLKGIVQAEVDAFCTEVPGQIAIRIKKVGSGLVPIPVNSIADRISNSLRRLGADVQWIEIERDPVALIGLPPDKVRLGDKLIELESIQLLENELVLTGKSLDGE